MSRTETFHVSLDNIVMAIREDSEMDFLAIAIRETFPVSTETGEPLLRVAIEPLNQECTEYLVTRWDPEGRSLTETAVIKEPGATRHRLFDADDDYVLEPFSIVLEFEEQGAPEIPGFLPEEEEEDGYDDEQSEDAPEG